MSPTAVCSETEVLSNQKTILQNQTFILKNQEEIKKNQETLQVIVKNQEKILAAVRHSRDCAPAEVNLASPGPQWSWTNDCKQTPAIRSHAPTTGHAGLAMPKPSAGQSSLCG